MVLDWVKITVFFYSLKKVAKYLEYMILLENQIVTSRNACNPHSSASLEHIGLSFVYLQTKSYNDSYFIIQPFYSGNLTLQSNHYGSRNRTSEIQHSKKIRSF